MDWPCFWDFPSEFFWFRSVDQLPRFSVTRLKRNWVQSGCFCFVLWWTKCNVWSYNPSAINGLLFTDKSFRKTFTHKKRHLPCLKKKWIVDVHFENILISSKANPRRPNICKCLLLDHVTPNTFPPLPDWRRHGCMNPITCFPFLGNKNSKFSWFWAWVGICALSRQHVYWLEAIQYEEGKSKITTIYLFNFPIYSCTG